MLQDAGRGEESVLKVEGMMEVGGKPVSCGCAFGVGIDLGGSQQERREPGAQCRYTSRVAFGAVDR